MKKRTVGLTWLTALAGLLALSSCDSATSSGMGTVRLYLASSGGAAMVSSLMQDPPTASLSDPRIRVVRVELIPGRHVIAEFGAEGQWFSLTPAQNDVSALLGTALGTAAVPAGDYSQLRLILNGATVAVDGGEPQELIVPSGSQTGVKFDFPTPLHIEEDGTTNLWVQFDLDHSYVVTGAGKVLFRPVIHASTEPGGSITGTVTLNIAAAPTSDTPVQLAALIGSDTISNASIKVLAGAKEAGYALLFLPWPRDYVVSAKATVGNDTYVATSGTVSVPTATAVVQDLTLNKQ